jgi:hypothetical protein
MPQSQRIDTNGTQVTVSEGHRFPPPKGSLADAGGDFFTYKNYVEKLPKPRQIQNERSVFGDGKYPKYVSRVKGPIIAYAPQSTPGGPIAWPPSGASSNSALDRAGATAIAQCKPTNSVADLSTFLGETIREGLPRLIGSSTWESRTLRARQAGEEYLNVQFGWRPLISDITDFGRGVTHAREVVAQYERDAGKVVRRKYYFPTERTSETFRMDNTYPPGTSQITWTSSGELIRTRETVRKRWFSGAFTYYLPTGYDSRSEMDRLALLADRLGLDLKPDVVWNLSPWSWAADWFTNAGDVLSNVTAFKIDGLVMRYGYIMEHTVVRDTYSLGPCTMSNGIKVQADPITYVTETKVRRQANPFGFGVTWDGLSPFQLSILAALGVTRKR